MAARALFKQTYISGAIQLKGNKASLPRLPLSRRSGASKVYSMSTEGNHGARRVARSSLSKIGLSALVLMSLTYPAQAEQAKNVLGGPLELCCTDPMTGFNRDGYCRVTSGDFGVHAVCAQVDAEFLEYTASQGNDLSSVVKAGQKWCLCASRWLEAMKAGKAPKVVLASTSEDALKKISLEDLKAHAVDQPTAA